MKNEVRLELRARNNRLWHAIFDKFSSVSEMCAALGKPNWQSEVGGYLNLTRSPYYENEYQGARRDQPKPIAQSFAAFLDVPFAELFPIDLYLPSARVGTLIAEVPLSRFRSLAAARHLALPATQFDDVSRGELRAALDHAIETIPGERDRDIIRRRFGLVEGEEEESLRSIGDSYGVGPERIRQIEYRVLRKLRHPSRARPLRDQLLTR